MNTNHPTSLELAAIAHALSGPQTWKHQLLEQLHKLHVSSRENSGAGFYTYFVASADMGPVEIPPEAYSVPPQCFATHPAVPGGAFFLLWLKEGRIDCLEAATGTSQLLDESGFVFT